MLDTSIWVECNEDEGFREGINQSAVRHKVNSSDTIDQEIEDACRPLAEKDIAKNQSLRKFYDSFQKAVKVTTDEVRETAEEYYKYGEKIWLPVDKMKADLAIAASAPINSMHLP